MEMIEMIRHPEKLDRNTLYELRSILAIHPYHQTARLLMLRNLYLLHDADFDEELRRAAIYVTDRRCIFQMIEAAHYQIKQVITENQTSETKNDSNRTVTLIDTFLDSIPVEEDTERHKPTPADATVDYVAYLLANENGLTATDGQMPQMKGQDLIDTFLSQEQGRIILSEPTQAPAEIQPTEEEEEVEEEYFTETLARIYIKQGRYQKAYDIIERLNRHFPQKNAYFADQMRFLEKLIINNNNNKNKQ